MKVTVKSDISGALVKLRRLPEQTRDKAIAAAINKTIDKGRTEMTRQITAVYNVKAKDVRPQLSISKASARGAVMEATLKAFGRRRGRSSRNVIMFDARQVQGKGKARKERVKFPNGQWRTITVREGGGVSVKIKRSGGRKLIPHAFIGNQGRTVFIRTGDARTPIKAVETVDIPQMFNTRAVMTPVADRVRREFKVELQRAINLYTGRQ